MKSNVIFIHGTWGDGKENWFPWLKEELEKIGYTVVVPRFPTPEGQKLENWLKVFSEFEKFIDEETIIVAHSIGSSFTLRMLERINKKLRACFLVAPYVFVDNIGEWKDLVDTFVGDYDWEKIKKKCSKFYIFGSDNDEVVPIDWVEKLRDNLHGKLFILKNAGHINEESGYMEFPFLLDKIKNS